MDIHDEGKVHTVGDRIKVVGYMPVEQFVDSEMDKTRPSGLLEQVENDLIEELGEHLDDIVMSYCDDTENVK